MKKSSVSAQAPRFEPTWRARVFVAAIVTAAWALMAAAFHDGRFQKIDFSLYDFLARRHPRPVSPHVVIVAIDEASAQTLRSQKFWPREYYARLINILAEQGATTVAFDVLFTSSSPKEKEADDKALYDAISAETAPPVIMASAILAGRLRTPFDLLAQAALCQGIINYEEGVGGVVRSLPVLYAAPGASGEKLENYFAFSLFAVAVHESVLQNKASIDANPDEKGCHFGGHLVPPGDFYPAFPASIGAVNRVSFADALDRKFDKDAFRGKLVFVGTTADPNDRFKVPISRRMKMNLGPGIKAETAEELMPGVEFHAIVASSLMNENFLRVPPRDKLFWPLAAATAVVLALSLCAFLPLAARLTAPALVVAAAAVAFEMLWTRRYFVEMTVLPVSAVVSCAVSALYEIYLMRLRDRGLKNIFGRYVSDGVMKKILSDPSRLGWSEDRVVTVLFCDVRSFTPMAEKLRPHETLDVLNTYFEAATAAVLEAGGSVDKFVGDEIMAVFNTPLDMPGHAMAALKTALNIIGSIPGVNRALAAKGLPSIAVGIGVHTGPVVAGSIGAKIRMEYGVIGDTVNTAARLVGVAPPMQIYTTAETVRCADGKVVVEPGGQLELKGKSKPIEVFRVLRLKDGSSA